MGSQHAQSTARKHQPRIGKDHLNLADWRISTASRQQRYNSDGTKLDYAEYVINRAGGQAISVTLESPATIGLPTAADEDLIIALLAIAKENHFDSDVVPFVPSHVLKILKLTDSQKNYDRLEKALKRLRAVTVTYKNAWYSREKRETEPVLITGILAEAKLVLRRGRRTKDAVPDSYVQWTKNFYTSLKDGNLTDLDLDLYFRWDRPGAKHLYRHLNKVWHAGKKPKSYERDLKELACGHLGMTDNKDLKRNVHRIIEEMERELYLAPMPKDMRYRKIRPGVWRVAFELHPEQHRAKKSGGGEPSQHSSVNSKRDDASAALVRAYHHHRFGRDSHAPNKRELDHAETLIQQYGNTALLDVVADVAKRVGESSKDDLYFGFAIPFFHAALKEHSRKKVAKKKQQQQDADQAKVEQGIAAEKKTRAKRRAKLLRDWKKLPWQAREKYHRAAIDQAASDFDQSRLRRCDLQNPPLDVLEMMVAETVPK